MNPVSNSAQDRQGWLKNQVSQFTSKELAQKKSPNIVRVAFGHWFDFLKFAVTIIFTFLAIQAILLGGEVFFTDITGITVIAPLEAVPEEVLGGQDESSNPASAVTDSTVTDSTVAATDSSAVDSLQAVAVVPAEEVKEEEVKEEGGGLLTDEQIRALFGTANDDYPEYIESGHFNLVLTINTIIALLVSIFVFYFHFFYLLSEDGQTFGLRFGKVELFRKDGRELSSGGGIGGIGKTPAIIYSVFYLLFLPVFVLLTKLQFEYAFLWSFIEGFKSLDVATAGNAVLVNILMMFGYWLLTVVIFVGVAFIIGILFHVMWIIAGLIANAVGKNEPEKHLLV